MTMKRLATWLLPVLLFGCRPSSAAPAHTDGMVIEQTPAPSTSVPQPGPGQPAKVATTAIVGAWEGAPCEGRGHVRLLTIDSDGTFMATDRVAPCPRGARCTWSGIILWKGTWRQRDHLVILDPDRSTRLPDSVPDALLVEEGPRALTEKRGSSCRYVPVL
jgi:hypothetical protein